MPSRVALKHMFPPNSITTILFARRKHLSERPSLPSKIEPPLIACDFGVRDVNVDEAFDHVNVGFLRMHR